MSCSFLRLVRRPRLLSRRFSATSDKRFFYPVRSSNGSI